MLDFVRVACAVPPVTVGDPLKNARDHCAILEEADAGMWMCWYFRS